MTNDMIDDFNRRVDEYFANTSDEDIRAGLERSNYEIYKDVTAPAFDRNSWEGPYEANQQQQMEIEVELPVLPMWGLAA